MARLATPAARAADLLPRPQPRLRGPNRVGVERQTQRLRLCDALRGPEGLPRQLPDPTGRRAHHPGVLDPGQDLDEFNRNIVGPIEVVEEYHA